MAFVGPDVSPEKRTGMTFRGKEIILCKERGNPGTGIQTKAGWYPDAKRIEAATVFAFTGDIAKTAELAKLPHDTVKKWRREAWFKEILEEIREENNDKLDTLHTTVIHKSQELLLDRLENGDVTVLRDGSVIRKPVAVKELVQISGTITDKRQIIRNKPTSISGSQSEQKSETEKLEDLKSFFAELVNKGKSQKKPEVIEDAEFREVAGDGSDLGSEQNDTQEQEPTVETARAA